MRLSLQDINQVQDNRRVTVSTDRAGSIWRGIPPYVTALTINRLAQREVDAVIDGVVGNRFIPANIRQDIIERTDGIPLFVEEMTKAALEAEGEGAAAQAVSMVPSPVLAVPASLHASSMAAAERTKEKWFEAEINR